MCAASGLMTLVPVASRLVLPQLPAAPEPAPAAVETKNSSAAWWKPVSDAEGLQEPTAVAPSVLDAKEWQEPAAVAPAGDSSDEAGKLPPPVPADELPPPVPAGELPPPVPAYELPPPVPMEPTPSPEPAKAFDDTMAQLHGIIMHANVTFNVLEDVVSNVTQQAMGFLAALNEAADEASTEDAHETATEVGDKLVVLITEMQDGVSQTREKLLASIQKQASAVAVLRPDVVSTFNTATEKVDALGDNSTMFLQVKQAQAQVWWPFPRGHHGSKDAFEVAEDAVDAANGTVTKVAEALAAANVVAIESMNELVLDKIETATKTFQERCDLIVVAQGNDIPEILGMQAMTICNSARSAESEVSATAGIYGQHVGENMAAAKESVQALYDATGELMDRVDAARAAAAVAEN